MNRFARKFQIVSGVFMLAALVYLVLPVFVICQENYPDKYVRPYELLQRLTEYSDREKIVLLCLTVLPVFLASLCGVLKFVLKKNHWVFLIGDVAVAGLFAAWFFLAIRFQPEKQYEDQVIQNGIALYLPMLSVLSSLIFEVCAFIARPRKREQTEVSVSLSGLGQMQRRKNLPEHYTDELSERMMQNGQSGESVGEMAGGVQMDQSGNGDAERMAEAAQSGPRGVLVGVTGVFAGAEIPMQDQEVLRLGRDTTNHLVFADQEKVSRNHCILVWLQEKKKYQIKDISSNGSFINGMEEPIPQNIPIYLEPGTILDIGDENNRFQLD